MTTGEGGHESDRPLCISGGCLCGGFGRRGRSWVAGGNGRRGRGRRACAAAAEDRLRPRRRGRFRPVRQGEAAPAKLNLALHVRRRRPDGYHELETLFAFVTHGDVVAVEDRKSVG